MAVEGYAIRASSDESHPLDMSPEQRRDIIRRGLEDLLPIVAAAYQARDWEHFGYASWDDYLSHEFGGPLRVSARNERQLAVVELRQAGMSTRAIAASVGVSDITVRRDLESATATNDAVELPASVIGLDGKERIAEMQRACGLCMTVGGGHRYDCPTKASVAVHFSSATDQWNTPAHIIDMVVDVLGHIDLDPCSGGGHVPARIHYTEEADGLAQRWFGQVYMNPPYGDVIGDWTAKLRQEYDAGDVIEAIALVPARVDTNWWHEFVRNAPWCAVRGRLKFGEAVTSAPFPSAAIYLGDTPETFGKVFSEIGAVYVQA
jgi:hypothetical protein